MKTVIFSIDNAAQVSYKDGINIICIPTLDCYALITTTISINGQIISEEWDEYSIDGCIIKYKHFDFKDSGLSITC